MGLDMYLDATVHLSKFDQDKESLAKRESIRESFPEIKSTGNLDYVKVTFEAGYWRKANAIHKWFVENVQYGEDECNPYPAYREQLESLLNICKQIKEDHSLADELLPTGDGFFFGSTEYDDWYFEDINSTIDIIEYALSLPDKYRFIYHSSW